MIHNNIITIQLPLGSEGQKDPHDYGAAAKNIIEKIMSQHAKQEDNLMSWVNDFTMTQDEINQIADPSWVYENLIIEGHISAWVAESNGGKTAIAEYVAGQLSEEYKVYYVNSDVSGTDSKRAYQKAEEGGYTLLLPDMRVGLSMNDVVDHLEQLANSGYMLTKQIWIFDTLKKMTDVINKKSAKGLYSNLRAMSAKGATIVLLAHTNKYKDKNGKPIYEGTGDLRADIDEMIYLIPLKCPDGSITVSTQPDKVRGSFEPLTFEITPDREVRPCDEFVDIQKQRKEASQKRADQPIVELIQECCREKPINTTEILKYCQVEAGISKNKVYPVLRRYKGVYWSVEERGEHNEKVYSAQHPLLKNHSHVNNEYIEEHENYE